MSNLYYLRFGFLIFNFGSLTIFPL